jgi:polysaccharide export outer membrane protein
MDVLAINVWGLADLSGKYPVDADGTISFPLVPRIRAAGLKPREVEAELRGQLASRYFRNPQVTATVERYHSQAVFVLGEVRRPGSYALTARMTLADALGRAGSTTSNASQQAIIIRALPDRGSDGSARPQQPSVPEVVKVDLRNLQRGGSQNPLLRDRDTIYVLAR